MPQPIYMPPDPSGWGPALSAGIDSFSAAYLREKERKQQANQMLLNMMMQHGGTISPEQMGQIESAMGLGQSPISRIGGKIGSALGITPEPKPYESPLRSLFEPTEGGYKIKGREERGLETFRKQKEIEEPFEAAREKRGEEKEKRLTQFRTEEDIRGELLKIDKLTGKKRQTMLDDLRAQSELSQELENKYFGSKLERIKQEATARGDIATTQAIDLLQKETPIKWEALKKEIELRGEEARKTERLRLEKQVTKEDVAAAKEKKANYLKTLSNINSAFTKWPGEEVSDDELEKITRLAETQGWKVISISLPKSKLGMDWAAKDKYTFQIVDPETGMPPKIYEETETKKVETKKPTYKYNPTTGKLEKQ